MKTRRLTQLSKAHRRTSRKLLLAVNVTQDHRLLYFLYMTTYDLSSVLYCFLTIHECYRKTACDNNSRTTAMRCMLAALRNIGMKTAMICTPFKRSDGSYLCSRTITLTKQYHLLRLPNDYTFRLRLLLR